MGGATDDGASAVMEGGPEPMSKNALKKLEKAKKAAEEKRAKEEVKKAAAAAAPKKAVKAQQAEDDEDMDPTVSGNGSRGGFIAMGGIRRF